MKLKRLLLAIALVLLSAGVLVGALYGIPQSISAVRELDTFWLLWPLIAIVSTVVITVLYKVLGIFATPSEEG